MLPWKLYDIKMGFCGSRIGKGEMRIGRVVNATSVYLMMLWTRLGANNNGYIQGFLVIDSFLFLFLKVQNYYRPLRIFFGSPVAIPPRE